MGHASSTPPSSGVAFTRAVAILRARVRLRGLAWSALVAGGYLAAAKVVLVLLHGHAGLGAAWLPAGIATAAVLLRGYEMLPAVAAGSLLAGLVVPLPFSVLAVAAAGNTLAAGASRAMLRQLQFRTSLQRMRDVVAYAVVAGIVTTALSALVVTISLGAA